MSIALDHRKFSFLSNHTSICSRFLMLVSKQVCEDSSRFIDSKRKRKKRVNFSSQRERSCRGLGREH